MLSEQVPLVSFSDRTISSTENLEVSLLFRDVVIFNMQLVMSGPKDIILRERSSSTLSWRLFGAKPKHATVCRVSKSLTLLAVAPAPVWAPF